tara:strand:- start:1466 stop:1870 length:405 start_codon:yes stop_codon:yes gene_type:complete
MYERADIFAQAEQVKGSVRMESNAEISHLLHGVKLIYDKKVDCITILDTTRGGDYFKEMSKTDYSHFYSKGWLHGVYHIALQTYQRKLDLIGEKIKNEVNTRKNDKHMKSLKESRKSYLNRYSKVKQKLYFLTN